MKITHVQLHAVAVPRLYATQIAKAGGEARGKVEVSRYIMVKATSDSGLAGWGEMSDVEPEDYPALGAYRERLEKFLIGRDPFDVQSLHADFDEAFPKDESSAPNQAARCAADMLCHDLQGQQAGVPVYQLLGGRQRPAVRVSWVAYIRDDLKLLREEIKQKVAEGFDAFKLKVGVDFDLDEARLAALREAAGTGASIKLDPNEGWNFEQAVRNIRRLQRFELDGVETPVAGRGAEDLARLRKLVQVPLLEHVSTPAAALEYLKHDSLDAFNIATTNSGGIGPARLVADLAQTAGVGLLLGSTVELGPGTLAQLHLGASIRQLTLPSDLIGPGMLQGDVLTTPLRYDHGRLAPPDTPGLGIKISPELLEKYADPMAME
ncbi:MAG: mandelate racemase/muconate lactonizing enzyme family protein [Pirellulales bacterium]